MTLNFSNCSRVPLWYLLGFGGTPTQLPLSAKYLCSYPIITLFTIKMDVSLKKQTIKTKHCVLTSVTQHPYKQYYTKDNYNQLTLFICKILFSYFLIPYFNQWVHKNKVNSVKCLILYLRLIIQALVIFNIRMSMPSAI